MGYTKSFLVRSSDMAADMLAVRVGDPDLRRPCLGRPHGRRGRAAAVRRLRGVRGQVAGRWRRRVRRGRRGQSARGPPVRGEQQLGRGHVAGPERGTQLVTSCPGNLARPLDQIGYVGDGRICRFWALLSVISHLYCKLGEEKLQTYLAAAAAAEAAAIAACSGGDMVLAAREAATAAAM